MVTREHIVGEIRRIAIRDGKPPGKQVFERETGIRTVEWHGVHWRSWTDALTEAGYEPNTWQGKLDSEAVLRHYAEAARHFGRLPAYVDLRMYARQHKGFPGHSTFNNHFGSKSGLIAALAEWVRRHDEFADIIELLPETTEPDDRAGATPADEGFVYLLKSGDFYKIGRSDEIEQRVKQISVALPDKATLEHTIRTDDPPGIEAYWHRRFADRRANGEWFKLSAADVRAFKRRKYQ